MELQLVILGHVILFGICSIIIAIIVGFGDDPALSYDLNYGATKIDSAVEPY